MLKRWLPALLALAVLAPMTEATPVAAAPDPPIELMFPRLSAAAVTAAYYAPVAIAPVTGTQIYAGGDARCWRGTSNMGKKDALGNWKFIAIFTVDWCAVGGRITSSDMKCLSYEGTWYEYQNCTKSKSATGNYTQQHLIDWGYEFMGTVPMLALRDDVDATVYVDAKARLYGSFVL